MTRRVPIPYLCVWLPLLLHACSQAQTAPSRTSIRLLENRRLAIAGVRADLPRVRRFGRVELTVDLHGSYANPFELRRDRP